jgi:hypothetical protein
MDGDNPDDILSRGSVVKFRPGDGSGARYKLIRWRDLIIKPGPRCLVEGLIPAKSSFTIVAGWNGGKSVFASHLAMCVAAGLPFAGLATLQGPVVYNVGEGNSGFVARLIATGQRMGIALDKDIPLFVLDEAPDFGHEPGPALEFIEDIACQVGSPPVLVINDTLHRHLGGGDDADGADMANYSRNCKLIEDKFRCAVGSLHHPGHSEKKRGRGHSSWVAGLDTELLITGERRETRHVMVTKDRDLNALDLKMSFDILPEDIEANCETRSAPVMSIVNGWHNAADDAPAAAVEGKKKSAKDEPTALQQIVYDAFMEVLGLYGEAAPPSFMLPAGTRVVNKRYVADEAKTRGFYCDEKGEHENFRPRLNETIAALSKKNLVRSRGAGNNYYLWAVKKQ